MPAQRRCLEEVAFTVLVREVFQDCEPLRAARFTPAAISALGVIVEAKMQRLIRNAARLARYQAGFCCKTASQMAMEKSSQLEALHGLDLSLEVSAQPVEAVEAALRSLLQEQDGGAAKSPPAKSEDRLSEADVEELMGLAMVLPQHIQLAHRFLRG